MLPRSVFFQAGKAIFHFPKKINPQIPRIDFPQYQWGFFNLELTMEVTNMTKILFNINFSHFPERHKSHVLVISPRKIP